MADGDLQLYDENFEGLTVCEEGEPGYSWLQRIFFAAYNSMKNRGSQIDGMTLWYVVSRRRSLVRVPGCG